MTSHKIGVIIYETQKIVLYRNERCRLIYLLSDIRLNGVEI